MRRSRSRRSVGTGDSEARGPTSGVAGSGLSGTAGRIAAPLRGRHSRREDGRLDRLSRCCAACRRRDRRAARMAASGGCIRMRQLQAISASRADDSRRRALQQGQLRRPGRSQSRCWRERLGPDRGRGAQCELYERCHSRLPRRYRDRRMSFAPHLARAASRCAWFDAASSA